MDKRIRKEISSKNKQKSIKKILIQVIIVLLVISCNKSPRPQQRKVLAKYKDNYLYWEEVAPLLNGATSYVDSFLITKNFVEQWLKYQLLAEIAEKQLQDTIIDSINNYILEVRKQLLANAYIEYMLKEKLDTYITEKDYVKTYKLVKDKFPADKEYYKYIYIITPNWRLAQKIKNLLIDNELSSLKEVLKNKYIYSYSLDSSWKPVDSLKALFKKGRIRFTSNISTKLPYVNWIIWNNTRAILILKIYEKVKVGEPTPLSIIKNQLKPLVLHRKKIEFIEEIINKLRNEKSNKIFVTNIDSIIRK